MEASSQSVPAQYVIIHDNAAVRSDVSLSSPIVGRLHGGDVVRVVAVVSSIEDRRLRGRVESPAGWISLLDLDSGYRWARKHEPSSPSRCSEKVQLAEAIRQRDALVSSLRARVDELRARNRAAFASYRERAGEIEDKVLAARIIPVDDREIHPHRPAPPPAPLPAGDELDTGGSTEGSDVEEPPLPPGGVTVALRILEGHDADVYLGDRGAPRLSPAPPVPAVQSYMPLLPSAVHAQAWLAQKDYLPNVHPVNFTRADFIRANGGLTLGNGGLIPGPATGRVAHH